MGSFRSKIIFLAVLLTIIVLPQITEAENPLGAEENEALNCPDPARELTRTHYIRARNFYRKGEYTQAKEELEKVLRLEPGHQGAQWYLRCVQKELIAAECFGQPQAEEKYVSPDTGCKSEEQWRREKVRSLDKEEARLKKERLTSLREQEKIARQRAEEDKEETRRLASEKKRQQESIRQSEKERQEYKLKLDQLRQEQTAQLKDALKKYEYALQDKFSQKEDELSGRIGDYEEKLAQLEQERDDLEKIKAEAYADAQQLKQAERALKEAEKEREALKQELARMHQEQQRQLKDEFENYARALQDKFSQKEDELSGRIADYEEKLAELEELKQTEAESQKSRRELAQLHQQQQQQLKDEFEKYGRALEDKFARKKAAPADEYQVGRAEDKLLDVQVGINEQLRAELNKFKKEEARPFYEQGLEHFKDKKYGLAKDSFKEALSIHPCYAEAKEALENIDAQQVIDLHLAEGRHYIKEKEYPRARREFNAVLDLDNKNRQARNYLHKIEKEIKRERRAEELAKKKALEKEQQAQRQAIMEARKRLEQEKARAEEARRSEQARIRKEQERKAREARLAKLEARKEEQRKAREQERLARLKAEKEEKLARLKAKEERLARLEAAKEERLRLQREEEAKRSEQVRIREDQERKAREARLAKLEARKEEQRKAREQERLARLKAEKEEKLARLKAKEERLARLEAAKEERLRLQREEEAKRSEQARIREEEQRKAREARLAKIQAEKEAKIARLNAEKEERLRLQREEEARRSEQARIRKEQERKAREEKLAKLEARREEKLRLKREEEARRSEQARIRKEQERKASDERRAKLLKEREERNRLRREEIARLNAEKEERLRLQREEEAKRSEQARIREEEQRKAREARLAKLEARKEEQRKASEQEKLARLKAQKAHLARLEAERARKQAEIQKKIDCHYAQGKVHFENKDYIAARKEFKDILILDPKNKFASNALEKVNATEALEEKERQKRERERLQAERAKLEEQINPYLAQGKIHLHKKEYQKAIDEFGKVLFIDADNALAEKYIRLAKKRIAEDKRRAEKLVLRQRRAEQKALRRAQDELNRQAKEERLAKLKEELRVKREEERRIRREEMAKLREAQRKRDREEKLKEEKASQARKEEIALREARKEAERRMRQKETARERAEERIEAEKRQIKEERIKIHLAEALFYYNEKEYAKAEEECKQVLSIDDTNRKAREYLHKISKDVKRTRYAKKFDKQKEAEQQIRARQRAVAQARKRMKREERLKAHQERLAKLQAEKKERLQLQREEEARRSEQARLKKEEKDKTREEERLARLQAEKEEAARLQAERIRKEAEIEQKIQCHYAQGKNHFADKNYIAARKEFKDILVLDPNNKYALNALEKVNATEARQIKERQRKEEKIRQAKQREKEKQINKYFAQGKVYYYQDKYNQAIEEFGKALVIDPRNARAEKYILWCRRKVDSLKRQQQQHLEEEQRRKAEEEKLAKLKSERAEQEKRAAELKAKQEERLAKTREERLAMAKEERALKLKAAEERKLARLKAGEVAEEVEEGKEVKEDRKQEKLAKVKAKEAERVHLEKKKEKRPEEYTEEDEEKIRKIDEFFKKGKHYFSRGFYLESIACFEKVIELEGNPRILYTPQAKEYIRRAKVKIEEKKKDDAQGIAEEEAKRKRTEGQERLRAQQRAEREAQRKEEEIIKQHYSLGKKYYRLKNYPMAIAEFNKIKETNPQHNLILNAEEYIQRCRRKIILQEEKTLKSEMMQGLGEQAVTTEMLLEQARWYYGRASYDQTAKICRAALELDPLDKNVRNLLYAAELKGAKQDKKLADIEIGIDEKQMMAEVAEVQVLPVEETLAVPEKEITTLVKVPAIREKLKSPVSIDFRDVDLSYVLNFLAEATEVNIIPASGVSLEGKKVSIRMKDMPAENALRYILKNQGLTYRVEEDAVWVASPAELDREEIEPRVYFLNYGSGMFAEFERTVGTGTGLGGAASISKVTTVKDILEEAVDWPKNSKLVLDERSGALIVSNTPSNLQIIEEILYNLDITPMQVLVEARFVELEITDVQQLGIEWQIAADYGATTNSARESKTQFESGSGWDFTSFTRAAEGLNYTYTGVLTSPQFQTVLHALSETQNAKTLSAPRITTLNNQRATIKVVDEWIYPTRYEFQVVQSDVNGDGDFDDANETTYSNVPVDFVTKDVGIVLHVTPNVGGDGKTITLALVPEVSEGTAGYFSYTGSVSLPKFTSRTLSTSVVINNGDTVVLGGLVKETTSKTTTKVPILGDIPVLGLLFRKQNDSVVRKNLLIFVTASIISPSGEKIETVTLQQQ